MEEIINLINNNYKKLLNKENINKKYTDNNTILHYSVIYNNLNLLQDIIKQFGKKYLFIKNNNDETILHIASKNKLYNIIEYILDTDIKILDKQDINGNIGFHYLINNGEKLLELFNKYEKNIMKNKIDLNNISNKEGPLILNFIHESKKINDIYFKLIEKLLKLKIDINLPHNLPPLIFAVKTKKDYIVDLLLQQQKLDIDKPDINNVSAIFYAVKTNNISILKKLIEYNANINYYDPMNNIQFINYVIKTKNDNMINIILDNNINCNIYDRELDLPINFILINKFNNNIVKKFLDKTKDLNYQNIYGETPLYYLLKNYDWKDFEDILEKKELNIYIQNKKNEQIIDIIKNKDEFFELVIKSYLYYAKNNKDIKSEIIIKCYKENKLTETCIKEIRDLIEKEKSSIITKEEKINFINSQISYNNRFNPMFIYLFILYIYIIKKYKNISIPFISNIVVFKKVINNDKNFIKYKLNNWITLNNEYGHKLKYMDIFWYDKKIYWVNPVFEKAVKNVYQKKRFMLISLIIIQKDTNHQNFIIYDNKKNSIERFDPYGFINNENTLDLDNFLDKLFKKIIKNVKYISPKEFMNRIGFQNISEFEDKYENMKIGDPSGFCVAWCFWYLEMKLNNPDLDNIKLINKSIKNIINTNKSFTEYIRDYANDLFIYIEKIFLQIKLVKNTIYNKMLSKEIMIKLYNEIIIPQINKFLK